MDERSFWGWGNTAAAVDPSALAPFVVETLDGAVEPIAAPLAPPHLSDVQLPATRVAVPSSLTSVCRQDPYSRASHTHGKSFRDIVRGLSGEFGNAPDLVAFPESERDVAAIMDWCAQSNIACIPYGGGSSVVGGVEADIGNAYRGSLSLDLGRLNKLVDIDAVSRTAEFEGGVLGPDLEKALRPHNLTLRHFPQSFEFSTLGGWIATRAGGHFATMHTHIDDFVSSTRVVTPTGTIASRRLPSSGAGPSPDRLFLGSEGVLGVITAARVRLQLRPRFKAAASVAFSSFAAAVPAVRALGQSSLFPSNCRLLDAGEARLAGVGDGTNAMLLVGFESADFDVEPLMDNALSLVRDYHPIHTSVPKITRPGADPGRDERSDQWRETFLAAPYLRDALVRLGLIVETFETAITWDRFDSFHSAVMHATQTAVDHVCGGGVVQCRFTHVYPDGVAPYYTVIGTGRNSGRVDQWDEIKAAASEAIISNGGTITHHHAVGRDHRPWYDQQRPDRFAAGLAAIKSELDPQGILNPGVLIDPRGAA